MSSPVEMSTNRAETVRGVAPSEWLGALAASPRLRANAYLLAANLIGAAAGYLLHVVLGRHIALSAYGAVASLLALVATLLIPTQVISTIVARYAATLGNEERLGELNDLVRRLTRVLLLAGVAIGLLVILGSGPIAAFLGLDATRGVIVVGVMVAVSFVAPINLGAVQGLERFSWYALLTALPLVLRTVLASMFVLLGLGVTGAMVGILLGIVLAYLISFRPLHGLLHGPRVHGGPLRTVWSYSTVAVVTLTATVVLCNMDTPLAKHALVGSESGLYAAMAIIGKTMFVVGNTIVMVMFPRFVVLHSRSERMGRAVLEAVLSVLVPCLAFEALLCVAPGLVVRLLYGPAFVTVAAQVPWYGLAMMLLGVAQVFVYYFLAVNGRLYMFCLLLTGVLQGALFLQRSATIAQLVRALVVTDAILLVSLLALCLVSLRRAERSDVARL